MKTNTKKTSLIILSLLLMLSFTLNTLNAADFEKVWDYKMWIPPTYNYPYCPELFKQFKDNYNTLTHFPPQSYSFPYVVIDAYNFKKVYTVFNTGPIMDFMYYTRASFIYLQSLEKDVIRTDKGLLFIESPSNNPEFKTFIAAESLPGFPKKNGDEVLFFEDIETIGSTKDGGFVNFYLTTYGLYKLNKDMTELLASYKLPNNEWIDPGFLRKHIFMGLDELWLVTNNSRHGNLLHFDVLNEEWTIYNYPDIPITWKNDDNVDPGNGIFGYLNAESFLDRYWVSGSPKPIMPIYYYYKDGNNYYTDNALLYFNRETSKFDTIRIDLTNALYWKEHPNMYSIFGAFKITALKKILLTFHCRWEGTEAAIGSKYFMLFDWETKTFEVLAPPDNYSHEVKFADDYIDNQGNQCIGLLYSNGDFFSYNPKSGIFSLEAGAIPNLWFRSVYPNPTLQRIINANIMCYVEDLSKIDIGLYNLLGVKLLDLNNDYEYNDATKTIFVTFKVPKDIPVGTYYLNVNNGTEHRTQMIVISQ